MYILRVHSYHFHLSLSISLALANSVDPDEMLNYAAFILGLHCLLKYPFSTINQRVKTPFIALGVHLSYLFSTYLYQYTI